MITIEEVNNGFIIIDMESEINEETGEHYTNEEIYVIDSGKCFYDEDNNYIKNGDIINLLEKIAELLGYDYDRYGEENINIQFNKKGHKLE